MGRLRPPVPGLNRLAFLSCESVKSLNRARLPEERSRAYFPLGVEKRRVGAYEAIKPSAFLFRTPKQQGAFVRTMGKFSQRTSSGLELLALKRSREDRRQGSITGVARVVYRLIRERNVNLSNALNLTRPCAEIDAVASRHHQDVEDRKQAAIDDLTGTIDETRMDEDARLTGLFARAEDIQRLA